MPAPSAPVADAARSPDRTEVTGPQPWAVYDVWEPVSGRRRRGACVILVPGDGRRATLAPLAVGLAEDGFHAVVVGHAGMPGGSAAAVVSSVAHQVAATHADGKLPTRQVLLGHGRGGTATLELLAQDPPAAQAGLALAPSPGPRPALATALVPVTVLTGGDGEPDPAAVRAAYARLGRPEGPVTVGDIAGAGDADLLDPTHPAYLSVLAHLEGLTLRIGT